MDKLLTALKSRTVWTVVIMFAINGFSAIQSQLPDNVVPAVNGILSILAIYFRVNPRA